MAEERPPQETAHTLDAAAARQAHVRRFVRFVFVGILNTAFGYSIFTLIWWLTNQQTAAVVLSTVVGMLFNYLTIGRLVFANRGVGALPRFILGYGIVLIVNLMLIALVTTQGISTPIAQLLCLPMLVLISFAYNSLVAFRDNTRSNTPAR